MYLRELHVHNFRNLGKGQPVCVPFHQGLNLIVGENDAGKTSLIDAIRFCLGTRGQYYERITASDFFCGDGQQAKDFSIRCIFDGLSPSERSKFVEWLTQIPGQGGQPGRGELHVSLVAKLYADESVFPERTTGSGKNVEGELREYLQATYLRPLRDASAELRPGRRSRLAQILQTLPEMKPEKDPQVAGSLAKIMVDSQTLISQNNTIKKIEERLRDEYLADAAASVREWIAANLDAAPVSEDQWQSAHLALLSVLGPLGLVAARASDCHHLGFTTALSSVEKAVDGAARVIIDVAESRVPIQVGTIASIKGQTHDATLILQTSFGNMRPFGKFADALKATTAQNWGPRERTLLANFYVAATRPRKLLTIAAEAAQINDQHRNLMQLAGWTIVEVQAPTASATE